MSALTTTLGNAILSEVFGGTAYSAPGTWYFALFTADPTISGSATAECTYTSYARVSVTNNTTNFPAAASLAGASGAAITFPQSTGGTNTATHVGICAAGTAGVNDVRLKAPLNASAIITSGVTPRFAAGALTWSAA